MWINLLTSFYFYFLLCMYFRAIQIYLGNFKHDDFASATEFSFSLSQKQYITGKIFEIGLHLGLVLARQSFSI